MEELKYKPVAAFRLDDDTPFTDYSGYDALGVRDGTEVRALPVTSTALYGQYFDDTNIGTITVPDFATAGTEKQAWSVSLSVYFANNDGEFYIWKNEEDGWDLFLSNNYLVFYIIYDEGPQLLLRYDVLENKKRNIVITYTSRALSMFVDGELVDSAEIIEEFQNYTFLSEGDTFQLAADGSSSGTVINNLVFYRQELSNQAINAIHQYNSRHVPEEVPVGFGGQTIDVSTKTRKTTMEVVWDSDSEWNSGLHQNTVVENDQLKAQKELELTIDGKWSNSITFASPTALEPLDSAYLIWDAKNAEIEYSSNGSDWTAAVYGQNIDAVPIDFDSTDKTLFIRVNFIAGLDDAYVNSITLRVYTDVLAHNHIDERDIIYDNGGITGGHHGGGGASVKKIAAWDPHHPSEISDFWGANITGGDLIISPDPNMSASTVELWLKSDETENYNFSNNIYNYSSSYINGVESGQHGFNQWFVQHLTFDDPITDDIVISGNVQVGQIAIYPTVLNEDEINKIIFAYMGYPKSRVDDGATISVTEPDTSASISDHAWSDLLATT